MEQIIATLAHHFNGIFDFEVVEKDGHPKLS
jgi:hypothetical protein